MAKQPNFDEIAKNALEPEQKPDVKPTSLGKASFVSDSDESVSITPGYVEIYASNFPSKGLFYPADARFYIRAAETKEIRHYSTMDETNPFSVNDGLNDILKSCLMVRFPGKQASFKDLIEEDRVFIILTIRQLTMVNGEQKIVTNANCTECQHKNEIEITANTLEPNIVEDKIMQYYDPVKRLFVFQTKTLGEIEMKPPTIGIMGEVTKWIRKSQEEGKRIDESFVKVLPYLIKEWRGLNAEQIQNIEVEFISWNKNKYLFMYNLLDKIRVGVKETVRINCEKCGSEVTAAIQFPGGIKSLFVVSNIDDELL